VPPHPVTQDQALEFLVAKYGAVDNVHPLSGGAWSSAYGFSSDGQELVVRFGSNRQWFEADRQATAFASAALPVPEVLAIGEALGGAYAISRRCRGTNLEDVRPDQAANAGPMLTSLLGALFRVPKSLDLPVEWHAPPPRRQITWRSWLLLRLDDDPAHVVHGWRPMIAERDDLDRLYRAAEARVRELSEACPERRISSTAICCTPTSW
jgi:aminoglycoside phosphotransferase (APT) family kinase protein